MILNVMDIEFLIFFFNFLELLINYIEVFGYEYLGNNDFIVGGFLENYEELRNKE